jgi:hypothetical protein
LTQLIKGILPENSFVGCRKMAKGIILRDIEAGKGITAGKIIDKKSLPPAVIDHLAGGRQSLR